MKVENNLMSRCILRGKMSVGGLLLLTGMGLSSCNFLDFDQSIGFDSQEEVYEVFSRAEQSLTQVYTYLEHDFGSIGGAMRDCATDDAHYVWSNGEVHTFTNGRWSATNTIDAEWNNYYTGIRAANLFIKSMEENDFSKYKWNNDYDTWMEKSQYWIYEARFLRSLYLFELAKRYGDIPLATGIYTVEDVNLLPKSKFADVIAYIAQECKEVADRLPESFEKVTGKQTGRITKGAALALRARALLYAARPLHTEDDQSKWIAAAKAAKDVMDLGLYSLIEEENINNLASKELILERRMASSCDFEKKNFPISFDKGNTGTCPSQNLVDAFQTINGYDVTLTEEGWKSDDPLFNPKYPYADRDKRFYKTVLYDGVMFKGKELACYEGGAEGLPVVGASETGYYLRKYIIEGVDLAPNERPMNHYWVLFRYAEVVLNYAEAMNNAYGPDKVENDFTMTACEALNLLRKRSVKTLIPTGLDRVAFQKVLEREKRVEFAFENQRFWDIRRWKTGKFTQTGIDGVRITKSGDAKSYKRVSVETRTWHDKMNLYPIPMTELYKNNNLYPQNPGW